MRRSPRVVVRRFHPLVPTADLHLHRLPFRVSGQGYTCVYQMARPRMVPNSMDYLRRCYIRIAVIRHMLLLSI